MGEIIYNLTIYPVWLLLEAVFRLAYNQTKNSGVSIIFVSLVVNILILPLYLKSDSIQEKERNKQKGMEPWIKHIRRTFSGDERFMILSEYYRQNDYQPYYVLKSSLSLLLQIPFFIAAYQFLSELQLLHGTSFLMIKDLGHPDALLHLGGISINVLPILMTLINLVSSFIYTKNGPLREKVQTIAVALIFLVLLYNSPSGLVFYWTLNNLFSLGKNVVMFMLDKIGHKHTDEKKSTAESTVAQEDSANMKKIWFVSSVFVTILMGMTIPLSVITSAPLEFVERGSYADPTKYVFTTVATAAGYVLVWGGVVWYIATSAFKRIYGMISAIAAVLFFMNFMIFSKTFGILYDDLKFSEPYVYTNIEMIINFLVMAAVVPMIVFIIKKRPKIIITAISILAVSAAGIGIFQTVQTSVNVRSSEKYKASTYELKSIEPVLELSSTGKNIVIIVLDRALGGYIPYILKEKPELAEAYSGFTFYPNSVSLASGTIPGVPAVYGGYEYTTWDIDQRDDELLKDKINESITMLPKIFAGEGYLSTVCDIPCGNLSDDDPSVFEGIEGCKTVGLTNGTYSGFLTNDEKAATNPRKRMRNFFCYSLCRVVPLFMQNYLYDGGNYRAVSPNRVTNLFANSYIALKYLPKLTKVVDDDKTRLLMMHNNMTHEGTLMDPPDYVLRSVTSQNGTKDRSAVIDGRVMNMKNVDQTRMYDSSISAYILISKWLQSLKDAGVYDNTRIIITADHGSMFGQFDDMIREDIELDADVLNPVLMVKDFGSTGNLTTDDSFMSNGDVPSIAMEGIIDNPVNPYTGNPVNTDRKSQGPLIVLDFDGFKGDLDDYTYDLTNVRWYKIHDSIFEHENWEKIF